MESLERDGEESNTIYYIDEHLNNTTYLVDQEIKNFILSLFAKLGEINPNFKFNTVERIFSILNDDERYEEAKISTEDKVSLWKINEKKCIEFTEDHCYGITGHLLGMGQFKAAKLCFELSTKELFVRTTAPHLDNTTDCRSEQEGIKKDYGHLIDLLLNESRIQKYLKDEQEFVQIIHSYKFLSKKGHEKVSMLLEFCDGGDLQNFFEDKLKLKRTEESRFQFKIIFHDILLGLVKLQRLGIVHRDLKPANIFLKKIEGIYRGKIGDFGLAISNTQPDNLGAGTPLYMSPEYTIFMTKNRKCLSNRRDLLKKIQKKGKLNTFEEKELKNISYLLREYKHKDKIIFSSKNDLWSFGMMIYEYLYKKNLYEEFCNVEEEESLENILIALSQKDILKKCDQKTFKHPFENGLKTILKKIFVLSQKNRGDSLKIYELYCRKFKIPPQIRKQTDCLLS